MMSNAEASSTEPVAHHNLPLRLTSFVGREQEIAEIVGLLGAHRLVTLVGAPGVGKTRLSLQVAMTLHETFADSAWLVELAPLTAPELVPQAVADALRVHEQPGRSLSATLAEHLRTRHLLLVLDNCEHLIEVSATLVEALLQACPRLHIIATSREPLAIEGEVAHRVPSLSVPDVERVNPARLASAASLTASEAVRLFVERARAVVSSFALTNESAGAVARICARLDGIPLALELAAARVRALSLEQIASRLDDCFHLLTGGSRTALPRLQTLRGAVDWSYNLLSEPERALLRRLAVFAGGFALDAIESTTFWVAGAEEEAAQSPAPADVLVALIDKSLVQVEETPSGEKRYRLLETLRQYGQEKLAQHGELASARDRHRDYFLEFAEENGPAVHQTGHAERLRRLEAEHDNLRAALGWCLEQAHADDRGQAAQHEDAALMAGELGLRLAAALYRYWSVHVHQGEGRRWLERLLALPVPTDTPARCSIRADALHGAALMTAHHGEYWGATRLLEEAVGLCRIAGDESNLATVLGRLALYLGNSGEFDRATVILDEALVTARRLGNPDRLRQVLLAAASVTFAVGDLERAARFGEECVALGRALGSTAVLSYALQIQCRAVIALGDLDRAQALAAESFRMAQAAGNTRGVADSYRDLGHIALLQGDPGLALSHYQAGLEIVRKVGDRSGIALCIRGVARATMRLGTSVQTDVASARPPGGRRSSSRSRDETERLLSAVRLFAAALSSLEALHYTLARTHQQDITRDLAMLRDMLGEAVFSEAWAEGQAMPLDQTVEYARGVTAPRSLTARPGTVGRPATVADVMLSRREEQVAALVSEGLSNPQIASRLGLSDRTIDAHLRNIMGKLDVSSRAQVASWSVRQGLTDASSG